MRRVCMFAAALLMRGTTKHDKVALQDALTASKAQLFVLGDATGVQVSIVVDREHMVTALELAAEVLQHPLFPESDFDNNSEQVPVSIR